MKNKYKPRTKRPIPPDFVKVELYLPELTHITLNRYALGVNLPLDRVATLGLIGLVKQNRLDLLTVPELVQTGEGSESYPLEQDLIYNWLKGMGGYGFEYDELVCLCLDIDMTLIAMSYAINGLMDKKLIERRGNTFYVTKKVQAQRLFKSVKGKRVFKRKKPTLYKKEVR